jgi:CheY-like chemotaxis protein
MLAFLLLNPKSVKREDGLKDGAISDSSQKGNILVMEDDRITGVLAIFLLQQLHYSAEVAVNGEEALLKYLKAKEAGRPHDAVILDVNIAQGMGAEKTIRHLLEIDPDIKAIVSSGYQKNPLMVNYRRYGFAGVLPKPYGKDELGAVLASTL